MNENSEVRDFVGLDVYNLMFRAFHGNKMNLSHNGVPTNAVYTVSKMVLRILGQFDNLYYAVSAFDGGKSNFRHELVDNYKEGRASMPDELRQQIPYIEELLQIMGFNNYRPENFEADDALGCLGSRAAKKGVKTVLFSGDKDFLQLVQENLIVVNPSSAGDLVLDREGVFKKLGVYPEVVAAYLALTGDGVDNIEGVSKWGKGTAAKYLNQYGDLNKIIANANDIKGVVGENLREAISNGNLDLYLKLTTIPLDLDLQLTNQDLFYKGLDVKEWNKFCQKLNFRSLFLDEGFGKPSAYELLEKKKDNIIKPRM